MIVASAWSDALPTAAAASAGHGREAMDAVVFLTFFSAPHDTTHTFFFIGQCDKHTPHGHTLNKNKAPTHTPLPPPPKQLNSAANNTLGCTENNSLPIKQ